MTTSTDTNIHIPYTTNSLHQALHILHTQSSPVAEQIKSAERAILHWEDEQGTLGIFLRDLLEFLVIVAEVEEEEQSHYRCNVNLLILLILKNVVHRRWKVRGRRGIASTASLSEGEKEYMRMFLMRQYVDVDPRGQYNHRHQKVEWMAIAALVAKIARMDLPLMFKDLIPKLVRSMSSQSVESGCVGVTLTGHRLIGYAEGSAIILNDVLNELLSKRLLVDKNYFSAMAVDVFSMITSSSFLPQLRYIVERLDGTFGMHPCSFKSESEVVITRIALYNLTIMSRIIGHLLLGGFASLMDSELTKTSVDQTMSAILECMSNHLCQILVANSKNLDQICCELFEEVSALYIQLTESLIEIQARHSLKFVFYLQAFMEVALSTLFACSKKVDANAIHDSPFILPILRFLSNIISSSEYTPEESSNESLGAFRSQSDMGVIARQGDTILGANSIGTAVQVVWVTILTSTRISDLLKLIIFKFMPLSIELLEEWDSDSEFYFLADQNSSADEQISAAAQNFFLALMESCIGRPVGVTIILEMIQDYGSQATAVSLELQNISGPKSSVNEAILTWDAIYTAVGISVNILSSQVNFSSWFNSCLGPALNSLVSSSNHSNALPILKRRIIWLIGCHTNCVSTSANLHSALLSCLTDSSGSNADISVKLTSVESLTSIIYEPGFDRESLVHIMADLIKSLYNLLLRCNQLESRQITLSSVALLIGLSSQGSLTNEAANEAVSPLNSIWLASDDQNVLRKEVICIVKSIAAGVGNERSELLYSSVAPMLTFTLDPANANECLYLIEDVLSLWLSLLRLANQYNPFFDHLFESTRSVLERDFENLRVLMLLMEGYILLGGKDFLRSHSVTLCWILNRVVGQVRPRGASYIMLVLEALLRQCPSEGGQMLFECGIINTMLINCAKNHHNADDCEEDMIIIYYLSAFARILLSTPQSFDSLFPICCKTNKTTISFLATNLIELYWQKYDHVNQMLWKKSWIVLFFVLLPPTNSCFDETIIKNFDGLVNNAVDYLLEEQHRGENSLLSLNFDDQSDVAPEVGNACYKNLLFHQMEKDSIINLNLSIFIKAKMEEFHNRVGDQVYNDVLSSVEPILLKQLHSVIAIS